MLHDEGVMGIRLLLAEVIENGDRPVIHAARWYDSEEIKARYEDDE
jgi:hypothetical protein